MVGGQMQEPNDVTEILLEWTDGDPEALNRLVPLVYRQLKQLAHARLRQASACIFSYFFA